ncbi:hypothetical protein TNCV_4307881 [Trichonephila clavipes]|nr:hypothetical protein TNCV_4307881 [Trichonephila clavipes]
MSKAKVWLWKEPDNRLKDNVLDLIKDAGSVETDSNDENERNKAAPVPTLSQMRNIMKNIHGYLDAHFSGKMDNKMDHIEQ